MSRRMLHDGRGLLRRLVMKQEVDERARAPVAAASGGCDRQSIVYALELRVPPADVPKGKRLPGRRRILSECASPLAKRQ
jgi:hypothetical protein